MDPRKTEWRTGIDRVGAVGFEPTASSASRKRSPPELSAHQVGHDTAAFLPRGKSPRGAEHESGAASRGDAAPKFRKTLSLLTQLVGRRQIIGFRLVPPKTLSGLTVSTTWPM